MGLVNGQLLGGHRVEQFLKDGHRVLHDDVQLLLQRVVDDVVQLDQIFVVQLPQQLNLPLDVRLAVRYLPQPLLLHNLRRLALQGGRVEDLFHLNIKKMKKA